MAKHDVNTGLYLVAMVGIVAVIGLIVLVMNNGGSSFELSTEDLSGDALKKLQRQEGFSVELGSKGPKAIQEEPLVPCSDTDAGLEYDEQGTVSGTGISQPYSMTDYCAAGKLWEFYCNQDGFATYERAVDCEAVIGSGYECLNGECVLLYDDGDGDGILDDGDFSGIAGDNPCIGGNTVNCDDNCINDPNTNQDDSDNDEAGDVCDNCVNDANEDQLDTDADGFGDACDNCPNYQNADQVDADADGVGDVCDGAPNFEITDITLLQSVITYNGPYNYTTVANYEITVENTGTADYNVIYDPDELRLSKDMDPYNTHPKDLNPNYVTELDQGDNVVFELEALFHTNITLAGQTIFLNVTADINDEIPELHENDNWRTTTDTY
jgi:hypothetical protein